MTTCGQLTMNMRRMKMMMSPRRWSLLSQTYKHPSSKALSAVVVETATATATAIGGGGSFQQISPSSATTTWRTSNTASTSSRSVFAAAAAATDTAVAATTISRRLFSSSPSGSKTPPPNAPNTTIIYQQQQRPSFTSVVMAAVVSTAAVLLGGRWGYGKIFGGGGGGVANNEDYDTIRISNTPRTDRSKVTIVLSSSSPKGNDRSLLSSATDLSQQQGETIMTTTQTQQVVQQDVDLQDLYRFLQDQREVLQSQKLLTKQRTREILHQEFNVALEDCHDRGIQRFADWYFSYTTTYKLMSRAMKTAASHVVSFNNNKRDKKASMQDAVQQDLQRLICEKYQVLVLRPTITDPKLHRAVIRTLQTLLTTDDDDDTGNGEGGILTIQTKIDESMRQFIQNQQQKTQQQQHSPTDDSSTSSLSSISSSVTTALPTTTTTIPPDAVVLDLDWSTQLQKAQHIPLAYEKAPKELSVALVGGGGAIAAAGGAAAVASKGAGAATAGAAAVKSAGATAITTLSAKLASPFAAKAVGTTFGGKAVAAAGAAGSGAGAAAATAASTAAGAAVGGPVGAAIGGALVGVAVDMTLNKGLELIQRDNFVNDVHESLDATQLEWEERIIPELDRTIDESWFQPIEESLQKQQVMIVDRMDNTSNTNSSTTSNTKDHPLELKSETTTTTTTTAASDEGEK